MFAGLTALSGRPLRTHRRCTTFSPTSQRHVLIARCTAAYQGTIEQSPLLKVHERGEHWDHAITLKPCTLSAAVSELTGVDAQRAQELIALGAIFFGEEIKGQAGKLVWRRHQPWKLQQEAQQPTSQQPHSHNGHQASQRPLQQQGAQAVTLPTHPDVHLTPGTLIRCHPHPRRFYACYTTDWHKAVLHLDHELLVINKPGGVPCMPHQSNGYEEVAGSAGRALGIAEGLEVGHRLDMWTTGVLVLTRNKAANARFKTAISKKEAGQGCEKQYLALTARPVPLGELTYFMYDGPFNQGAPVLCGGNLSPRGPRLLSHTHHQGWRECRLQVLSCQPSTAATQWWQQVCSSRGRGNASGDEQGGSEDEGTNTSTSGSHGSMQGPRDSGAGGVQGDSSSLSRLSSTTSRSSGSCSEGAHSNSRAAVAAAYAGPPPVVYESRIRLITGRTHQIRAQLAAVGAPILGDPMYGSIPELLVDESGTISDPSLISRIENLSGGWGPLGLHAASLTWEGRTWTAPAPWTGDVQSR